MKGNSDENRNLRIGLQITLIPKINWKDQIETGGERETSPEVLKPHGTNFKGLFIRYTQYG